VAAGLLRPGFTSPAASVPEVRPGASSHSVPVAPAYDAGVSAAKATIANATVATSVVAEAATREGSSATKGAAEIASAAVRAATGP